MWATWRVMCPASQRKEGIYTGTASLLAAPWHTESSSAVAAALPRPFHPVRRAPLASHDPGLIIRQAWRNALETETAKPQN